MERPGVLLPLRRLHLSEISPRCWPQLLPEIVVQKSTTQAPRKLRWEQSPYQLCFRSTSRPRFWTHYLPSQIPLDQVSVSQIQLLFQLNLQNLWSSWTVPRFHGLWNSPLSLQSFLLWNIWLFKIRVGVIKEFQLVGEFACGVDCCFYVFDCGFSVEQAVTEDDWVRRKWNKLLPQHLLWEWLERLFKELEDEYPGICPRSNSAHFQRRHLIPLSSST